MVESKQKWKAWLYLAPAIVLLLVFTVWPIINTVRMAFLEGYSGLKVAGGESFAFGVGNFVKVIKYQKFLSCLKNTVLLCMLTVPISSLLALLVAVFLNSIKWLQKPLQTIFFLPYVTNSIAIGMVFAAMFNIVGSFYGTDNEIIVTAGIINNIIEFFGGKAVNWINYGSSYAANITVMVIYIVWNALPFKILILLGGLQSINKQYYDAAKVDGTKDIKYLWKVMVPLSLPTLISITILKMMGAWNSYIWPRLVANDDAHRLITNGLRSAFTDTTGDVNYPVQMAAVALVSAPLFLVFVFLRKYIMSGVSRSGIKG